MHAKAPILGVHLVFKAMCAQKCSIPYSKTLSLHVQTHVLSMGLSGPATGYFTYLFYGSRTRCRSADGKCGITRSSANEDRSPRMTCLFALRVLDAALGMLVRMENSQPSVPAGTTGVLHGALDHRVRLTVQVILSNHVTVPRIPYLLNHVDGWTLSIASCMDLPAGG